MEMVDASVVGIAAFLARAPRAALPGAIKTRPADFVVQEISLDGRVLSLDPDDAVAARLPTQSEREAVIAAMEAARQSSGKQRAKEPLVFADPPGGWRDELERELAKDNDEAAIIMQLTRVAASESELPCLIDAPTEFRDRVYLQVCIQHCFPSLDCRLRKPAAEAGSTTERARIEVVLDGMYKKFRAAGVSDDNASALLAFIRRGAAHPDAVRGVELAHEDSKEVRTALHRQISSASHSLKTRTETRRGRQCLVAAFGPHNAKKRKRADQPPDPFVRFVLQKTNVEHFTCFERLARQLKRPVSAFATAGTKDKVAITYQHVTVQGVAPERLLEVNQDANSGTMTETSSSSVRVGHIEYVAAPLALGALTGNRFTIIVRGLPEDLADADVKDRVDFVQRHGFINFFGFQRVGLPTSTVRPHQIGELIVAGKWEAAVDKIFATSDFDPPECAAAKAAFAANRDDVDAVLKLIPPTSMQVERAVLTGLKRFGATAWEAAIRNIPFGRRTMYLHAYQSFLFNALASYRIEHEGAKVVEGDLVRESDESVVVATAEKAAELNERLEQPLSCVVLPLPGSNVLRPTNKTGGRLQELQEEHGTATALSDSTELKGAYRALIERPRDVEWQRIDEDAGAVQLAFSLSSGCFATMCLREILHINL